MRKSKPLKFVTILSFVILVAGFVGFRAGVFEHYLPQNGDDSNPYLNEQLANTQGLPVDSPPLKKADSIRISPEMLGTSKSAIMIDQHMRFPATDSLKSDSVAPTRKK